MGGSTTQPMGASSLMGGANPMGQGAPQGQQEAQQRYDQAGGQGGQGAPQDMSQMGMMGQQAPNAMMNYGAPQGGMPQFLQQNSPALGSTNGLMNYGPPQGQGGPPQEIQQRFNQQNSMPAPDMSQLLHGMMGQGGQGQQEAQQRYDQAGGQGGQGAPQNMSQFAGNGMGMMGQQAPQNIPQFLQQNYPAMGAFPQLGTQAGAQGNIPIQAGARAPVAFGAPNPMGAPMLSELVKAPPPKVQTPEDYYQNFINQNPNFMNGGMNGFKDGGATHPQDTHTVIQNALRLLSNRN